MNTQTNNIEIIQTQEKIRILFIILNFLALYADTVVEKSLITEEKGNTNLSNEIYLGITIINVFVLFYYILLNNKSLKDASQNNQNTNKFEIKNIAFILSLIAVILFIYVQLISSEQNNEDAELY